MTVDKEGFVYWERGPFEGKFAYGDEMAPGNVA